jgi:hypothetical protein
MTRARALKQVIRARAAKTGERYTTARRHVLNTQSLAPAPLRAVSPSTPEPEPKPAPKPAPKPSKTASAKPKTSISDAKFRQKTGHGLDHWFEVLDRFGAVEKGHTAAAHHLYEAHGVEGWYAQGITVAYERARGVRAANQRCDGAYEVSVSKVMAGDARRVIDAITDPRSRRRLTGVDSGLATALWQALDVPSSKGFIVRPDGLGRFRYKWGETTVQLYLAPKPGGKVSVVATNMNLSGTAMVEERRAKWRAALESLAKLAAS